MGQYQLPAARIKVVLDMFRGYLCMHKSPSRQKNIITLDLFKSMWRKSVLFSLIGFEAVRLVNNQSHNWTLRLRTKTYIRLFNLPPRFSFPVWILDQMSRSSLSGHDRLQGSWPTKNNNRAVTKSQQMEQNYLQNQ